MDVSSCSAQGSHNQPSVQRKRKLARCKNLTRRNPQTSPEGFGSKAGEHRADMKPSICTALCAAKRVGSYGYLKLVSFATAFDWPKVTRQRLQLHNFSQHRLQSNYRFQIKA